MSKVAGSWLTGSPASTNGTRVPASFPSRHAGIGAEAQHARHGAEDELQQCNFELAEHAIEKLKDLKENASDPNYDSSITVALPSAVNLDFDKYVRMPCWERTRSFAIRSKSNM